MKPIIVRLSQGSTELISIDSEKKQLTKGVTAHCRCEVGWVSQIVKYFYFFHFLSTQFADYTFMKLENADNICIDILSFIKCSLVYFRTKHSDWAINL